jgi:tetratricopeptide (TPR) repeat protein
MEKKLKNEDQLIIQAIFLEEQSAYKQSNEFYALLYEVTKKEEYLLRELSTAHLAGLSSPNLHDLKIYIQNNPNNLQAQRLLLSFYLREKKFEKAKEIGNNLTQHSKQAVDFELAANPYIFSGEYEASLKYLKEAYNKTLNEDILLKIVTIQINYLQNINDAIENLENHRGKQGCSEKICLQLIRIYSRQHKTEKLIPLYKELYQGTKKEIYSEKVIESYLINQDLSAAIDYLESETNNHTLLYSLYMEQKSYTKANNLAKRLIKKTNNPKWYAESAISFYESLSNKDNKEQLQQVIDNFEQAIKLGEKSPVYLNYYGYTLIDKEINIEKGLKIIEKALAEEPENTYFLDSLAWGYYKLNNCKKAYPTMKKVVEVEGLNEEEIIEHWNAIHSTCKNK